MKRTIGTNYFNYPQQRNFVNLFNHSKNYEFKEVKDTFRLALNIYFYFTKGLSTTLRFLFYKPNLSDIHILHFFNTVSLTNKPWIVTFETTLPRLGSAPKWLYNIAIKRLQQDSCKQIIAISDCSAKFQASYLKEYFPNEASSILSKMVVIHPPQETLINDFNQKPTADVIHFTLIGADFFRKGGAEILTVFEKIFQEGDPVKLTIVSSLQYNDYASKATKKDYDNALKIIKAYPEFISHCTSLPNRTALDILINSHVGLLPTYADTYGYSVLEAQAAGCPVISTNVRALPEINNNECGWVIEVPKDVNGNALIKTADERGYVSAVIQDRLYGIIKDILEDKSIIRLKGERALERIRKYHNPSDVANILSDIYGRIE